MEKYRFKTSSRVEKDLLARCFMAHVTSVNEYLDLSQIMHVNHVVSKEKDISA